MAYIKKTQLIKELKTQLKGVKSTMKSMKARGLNSSSLAYSSSKSLVSNINKMLKILKGNEKTTKVTRSDIAIASKLLQQEKQKLNADIEYLEKDNFGYDFDFDEELMTYFDESSLYRIGRELIEEGYGSAEVISAVEDMKTTAFPSSYGLDELKAEMISLVRGYALDLAKERQEERESFEKGFKRFK